MQDVLKENIVNSKAVANISCNIGLKSLDVETDINANGVLYSQYLVQDFNRKANYRYDSLNEAIRHYNNICRPL